MPSLHVVTSTGQIFDFPLSKTRVTIGRGKDNDLVLAENTVSRHHAQVSSMGKEHYIADLGSFNGTRVNGRLIQSAPIRHNDRIQVGLVTLTYLAKDRGRQGDSVVLTTETDFDKGGQQIVRSSPLRSGRDSQQLLVGIPKKSATGEMGRGSPARSGNQEALEEVSALARSNKVLYVLYEISRQLNQIHEFDELLKRIMDLIFDIIDADYGFLALLGGQKGDQLIPVVVKHRSSPGGAQKEIRASRTLIDQVIREKVALLTSNAMADSRLDGAKSVIMQKIRSAMCVPLWRKDKIIGVIQVDSVRLDNQFTQDDLEILKAIGSQMAMVIEQAALNEQIREEERLRSRLERFHSPQIIEMVLKGGQETKDNIMDPKELTATILFSDIIGFTRLSEQMPPREVNIILNRYFTIMTDIVFKHDGTLDKYVGDGMMAVFGAPMEKEDDPVRAIRAALEMQEALQAMMAKTGPERRFDIRIGINTGKVLAGNIGSPKRLDYTVIGDPVNIASRLESIAGPRQILIGEETYKYVKDRFRIDPVGPTKFKGKSAMIMVYEVKG
jgi:adenylate cyclase